MDLLSKFQRIITPLKVKTRKYYGKLFGFNDFHYIVEKLLPIAHKPYESLNFLDVGSARDDMVLSLLEKFPNTKTYCFEPNPKQYAFLLKRFKFKKNINLYNIGLGDKNKEMIMNSCVEYPDCSSLMQESQIASNLNLTIQEIPVKIITLDSFLPQIELDFIHFAKIDAEGFEFQILKGAKESLKKIQSIYIEIATSYQKPLSRHHIDCFEFLHNEGFSYIGCFGDYFFTKNKFIINKFCRN